MLTHWIYVLLALTHWYVVVLNSLCKKVSADAPAPDITRSSMGSCWLCKGAFTLIRVRFRVRVRFFKYLAFHLLCLHWAASAPASFIRVRFFSTVHKLYMASALTRYFVKDADAEADTDADQCKRTLRWTCVIVSCDTISSIHPYPSWDLGCWLYPFQWGWQSEFDGVGRSSEVDGVSREWISKT